MTKAKKLDLSTLTPDALAAYKQKKAAAELEAEQERVDALSDDEVLALSGNGTFGPAIIGPVLYERAKAVSIATNDGAFGPAITDPDYGKKQAAKAKARLDAKRAAAATAGDDDDDDEEEKGGEEDLDPWRATTLSGAKLLAQTSGVSYNPGIKKQALIAKLKAAGVIPPPVVEDDEEEAAE